MVVLYYNIYLSFCSVFVQQKCQLSLMAKFATEAHVIVVLGSASLIPSRRGN